MSSEHDKTLEQREEERLMRAINHKKVSMNFPKPKVEQQAPKQTATPSNTSGLTWSQRQKLLDAQKPPRKAPEVVKATEVKYEPKIGGVYWKDESKPAPVAATVEVKSTATEEQKESLKNFMSSLDTVIRNNPAAKERQEREKKEREEMERATLAQQQQDEKERAEEANRVKELEEKERREREEREKEAQLRRQRELEQQEREKAEKEKQATLEASRAKKSLEESLAELDKLMPTGEKKQEQTSDKKEDAQSPHIVKYKEETKKLLCPKCFVEIKPGEEFSQVDDAFYHKRCFTCAKCNTPLQNFYRADGVFLCSECAQKNRGCCARCGKTADGDIYEALGARWHVQCFTCTQCGKQLTDEYADCDGKPFCSSECIAEYRGRVCATCHKPCVGSFLKVDDLLFHKTEECFRCTSCHTPFKNSEFYAVEGKPYCEACALKL